MKIGGRKLGVVLSALFEQPHYIAPRLGLSGFSLCSLVFGLGGRFLCSAAALERIFKSEMFKRATRHTPRPERSARCGHRLGQTFDAIEQVTGKSIEELCGLPTAPKKLLRSAEPGCEVTAQIYDHRDIE